MDATQQIQLSYPVPMHAASGLTNTEAFLWACAIFAVVLALYAIGCWFSGDSDDY